MVTAAQAGDLPGKVLWSDSPADVRAKIAEQCTTIHSFNVDPPSFPLARHSELHLVCQKFQSDAGAVDSIAFTFGDDKLVMLEARGGAVDAFGAAEENRTSDYLHFQVTDSERFVAPNEDAVRFLSPPALHPNLFTWANPFLAGPGAGLPVYETSAAVPEVLELGGKLDEMRADFDAECPLLAIEPSQRIWLPNQPAAQTQVNCFGLEYAGFPRKIEAVFGDGILQVVWILTGGEEEDRVRRALVAEFGEPVATNDSWEVFAGRRVALRKDKPEVLLLSESILPYYDTYFDEE